MIRILAILIIIVAALTCSPKMSCIEELGYFSCDELGSAVFGMNPTCSEKTCKSCWEDECATPDFPLNP